MPRIRQLADKYAMSDLGSHIKGRIEASGRTQQEIGEALNLSQQSVSRLLRNPERITVGMLRKIAKVVELDQAVILKTFNFERKKNIALNHTSEWNDTLNKEEHICESDRI